MQQKVLRVINVVIVRILDPDPPRFRSRPVNLVVPLKLRLDGQAHSKNSPRDWLNAGSQWYRRNLFNAVLHRSAHAWVFDHVTWNSWTSDTDCRVNTVEPPFMVTTLYNGHLFWSQWRVHKFTVILTSLRRPTFHNGNGHFLKRTWTESVWWINDWETVYTKPHLFYCKRSPKLIRPRRPWSLFLFSSCFIAIYFDCVTYI